MKKITAKSPTRIDLAGGTLDLWPLYLFHENSVTINLAIDIYTHATIIPRKDKKIILASEDTQQRIKYNSLADLKQDTSEDLKLLKVHACYWEHQYGYELITKSESPIGGGISGSSSLNISLCGAFLKLTRKKMETTAMIRLAQNLEAKVIHSPTGCQDYFPPFFGGMNLIELTSRGPERSAIKLNLKKFNDHFSLVYTGKPHHSGLNNWQIFKAHIEKDKNTVAKLSHIRDVALKMKAAVKQKNFDLMGQLFEEEYNARVALSEVFTSPEIERLKKITTANGAQSIKICGAGGGGCVFVWSEPNKKSMLEKICQKEGFQVLKAKPTEVGLTVKAT